MAKIKVNELEAGMQLASDVHDPNGRFLLGEGCELAEKHLKALQAWGVLTVDIAGVDSVESKLTQQVSPEILEKLRSDVRARFREGFEKQPFMQELFTEVVNYECEAFRQGSSDAS
ncbi:hypothetical protein [Sulfuriflexus mobilis]|uniref:hypothetical protein n=1 Tax=Sulfuriflexus mobilis TaxID=1811807 RepID=UPI000F83346C|nr:hypothetical protein [Sulfuriflexus mobilis]